MYSFVLHVQPNEMAHSATVSVRKEMLFSCVYNIGYFTKFPYWVNCYIINIVLLPY